MSIAAADEPEPTNADLIAAFQRGVDQVMAGLADIRSALAAFAPAHPEVMPEGLDQMPPMRGFMLDAEDGL